MLKHEIGDLHREDGEGVVEGIVLESDEVVEYDWTYRKTQCLEFVWLGTFKDIFSDNQNSNPWNSDILLCPGLQKSVPSESGWGYT